MSDFFPEKPILFYPSLAKRFGADEAILLSLLRDSLLVNGLPDGKGYTEVMFSNRQWHDLASFWEADYLTQIAESLSRQGVLVLSFGAAGTIRVKAKMGSSSTVQPQQVSVHAAPPVASANTDNTLPVYDHLPPRARPEAPKVSRGPAPTFGGTNGWRRQKDELEAIFEQHEERNQRMVPMSMHWKPSAAFHEFLARHSIPSEFAQTCLDEFVLYWLAKDNKRETNWDQKFLAWVKREWVKQQSQEARDKRSDQLLTGSVNENPRRDTRESRKRVTAAIMDIKDTDW
ncbi:hypothetical protein DN062_07900 [Nitrincola tibetensis]|uniref:DnaT DNA-binding domain-containing protein n=1 Tax=Nitrincola tibetensis TaxID=2219697 RepID=A0A364NP65_9GAMM|nr:DnaT-like ssDNA-binding domain-containing protein [Nitrincola tibetensis]RAU18677.1 hypothetical protein DN062_07900 [Nitrincola tibetensis]